MKGEQSVGLALLSQGSRLEKDATLSQRAPIEKGETRMQLRFAFCMVAALLLTVGAVYAQAVRQPLTNSDVVQMVKGGLPETTIINAINAERTRFDISASALIELQRQGVSPKIMSSMLAAARRTSSSGNSSTIQTPPTSSLGAPGQSVPTPPMPSGSIENILGAWQGVYFVYPQVMRVDLRLQKSSGETSNSLEGICSFQTLASDPRSISGTLQGSYAVRGEYDPSTGGVTLLPGQWIQRPTQLALAQKMTGVLDKRTLMVAGFFSAPNAPLPNGTVSYFVLARPDKAPGALFNPMKRIWEEAQPTHPHPHFGGVVLGGQLGRPWGSEGEDINKIANWAARLTSEYPNINLQNTYNVIPTQNLFEDSYFSANFGKTYDQLSEGERHKFAMGLRIYAGERDNEKMELRRKYYFLGRYFEGFNVPNVFLGVLAQRVLRSWRDGTLRRLQSLSTEEPQKSFDTVELMDKVAEQELVYLWPSERAAVTKEMNAARSRFAGPALEASAQKIAQSSRGYEGAVALASWESHEEGLLKWADEAEKRKDLALVQSKLNEVLTSLMAAELKELESFGGGLKGISEGRTWMENFSARFSRFASYTPVVAALNRAREFRSQALKESQAALVREIDSQKTVEGLDRFVATYLILPDDGRSEAGAAIVQRFTESRKLLAAERDTRDERARRASVLGVPLDRLAWPHNPPHSAGNPPSPEEMFDAVQARFDVVNEGLSDTVTACKAGRYANDPFMAITCLTLYGAGGFSYGQYSLHMKITRFRKISCVSAAPLRPGFVCDYYLAVSQDAPLPQSFRWLIGAGGTATARFVWYEDRWLSLPLSDHQ
jgi:hypothetical protein